MTYFDIWQQFSGYLLQVPVRILYTAFTIKLHKTRVLKHNHHGQVLSYILVNLNLFMRSQIIDGWIRFWNILGVLRSGRCRLGDGLAEGGWWSLGFVLRCFGTGQGVSSLSALEGGVLLDLSLDFSIRSWFWSLSLWFEGSSSLVPDPETGQRQTWVRSFPETPDSFRWPSFPMYSLPHYPDPLPNHNLHHLPPPAKPNLPQRHTSTAAASALNCRRWELTKHWQCQWPQPR